MDNSTKKVLLGLVAQGDAPSLAYVLNALCLEQVDADHAEVSRAALAQFSRTPIKLSVDDIDDLASAWSNLAQHVGPQQAVQLLSTDNVNGALLDLALPGIEPDALDLSDPNNVLELRTLAAQNDLGTNSALWFIKLAEGTAVSPGAFVAPTLRLMGREDWAAEAQLVSAARVIAGQARLLESAIDETLATEGPPNIEQTVGLFRLLALTGDPAYVSVVGPYLEDAGAWTYVSRSVFTGERMSQLQEAVTSSGLQAAIEKTANSERGGKLAERLAADSDFHKAVARLVGGRASLFGFVRMLVDKRVLGSIRSIVSDRDALIRLEAAKTITTLGTEASTEYLLSGVLDRDKGVRNTSEAGLLSLVGQERYDELVGNLADDVGFVTRQLESLGDWAQRTKESFEGTIASAVAGGRGAAEMLTGAARRLLRRDKS